MAASIRTQCTSYININTSHGHRLVCKNLECFFFFFCHSTFVFAAQSEGSSALAHALRSKVNWDTASCSWMVTKLCLGRTGECSYLCVCIRRFFQKKQTMEGQWVKERVSVCAPPVFSLRSLDRTEKKIMSCHIIFNLRNRSGMYWVFGRHECMYILFRLPQSHKHRDHTYKKVVTSLRYVLLIQQPP